MPAVWTMQSSVLTGFRVWVSISLGAAVRWCLLVVLLLGEVEGKRLGGAGRAAGLGVSQPAITAALLGTVWKMERDTALGLEHTEQTRNVLLENSSMLFKMPKKVKKKNPNQTHKQASTVAHCAWVHYKPLNLSLTSSSVVLSAHSTKKTEMFLFFFPFSWNSV